MIKTRSLTYCGRAALLKNEINLLPLLGRHKLARASSLQLVQNGLTAAAAAAAADSHIVYFTCTYLLDFNIVMRLLTQNSNSC